MSVCLSVYVCVSTTRGTTIRMMKIYGRTSSSRSSTEVGTECEANGEREGEGHRILHMHRGKGTTELLMAERERELKLKLEPYQIFLCVMPTALTLGLSAKK